MNVLEENTTFKDRPVWSKSQFTALKECSRKFFFSTYAKRPEMSDNAAQNPVLTEISYLKRMSNRHLWTGSVIHKSFGRILKAISQGTPLLNPDVFIQNVKEDMRNEYKSSAQAKEGNFRLFEHEYGHALPPETWQRQWSLIERSLNWFLNSAWLERFKALGPESWKAIDQILDFDLSGIKAYVKIDCAVETNGRFYLIDWKTSSSPAADDFPLLVSALYAHEVWGADPEAIDALFVSTWDGTTRKASVNEDTLMEAFLRIQEEAEHLQTTQRDMPSDVSHLPLPSNTRICFRCNFQRLCHPNGVSQETSQHGSHYR